MNELTFYSNCMPVLAGCDFCAASEAFLHADRILDFHVLIYVVSGCIYVTEEDVDYEVHEGQLLFLHSGIRHYGKKAIPKGTRWYFAHFYLDSPKNDSSRLLLQQSSDSFSDFCFKTRLPKFLSGLKHSEIVRQIADLADSLHQGNACANLTSMPTALCAVDPMTLWNANCSLFSILTLIAFTDYQTAPSPSLADQIKTFLACHITESFSAAALEKEFFLSYKHMASVFKKETGMTMLQYHTTLRMTEACRLLRSTLLSVGEISTRLGYQDLLYFSRCFHQTIGMSPSLYRRSQTRNY